MTEVMKSISLGITVAMTNRFRAGISERMILTIIRKMEAMVLFEDVLPGTKTTFV